MPMRTKKISKAERKRREVRKKFLRTVKRYAPEYIIYTDGAIHMKSGRGGCGIVVQRRKNRKIVYMASLTYRRMTSNRSELRAMIEAIRWLGKNGIKDYLVFSDSMYVVQGCNKWV